MRRTVALCVLTLAAACRTADAPPGLDVNEPREDAYRVLNGPATCGGCDGLSFQITGPDAYDATSAWLEERATPRRTLPALIELRRLTGDSGRVLELQVAFLDTVAAGQYDLLLRTLDGLASREVVLSSALVMTRPFEPPAVRPRTPTGTGPVRLLASVAGEQPDSAFELGACSPSIGCRSHLLRAGVPLDLRLPAEMHTFTLADVAANCTPVTGTAALDVQAGDELAAVEFAVACAPLAYLRIELNETGTDLDGDFELSCATGTCGFEAGQVRTGTVLAVRAGMLGLALTGVAVNCQVSDGANRTVAATAGDTVTVTFSIACQSPGVVRVRTHTTGTNTDGVYHMVDASCHGYRNYRYEGCRFTFLTEPGTVEYRRSAPLLLYLGNVAANCTVLGDNPVLLTTPAYGRVTEHVFAVSCT